MSAGTRRPGSSRREFLKGVGAAGAGLVAGSLVAVRDWRGPRRPMSAGISRGATRTAVAARRPRASTSAAYSRICRHLQRRTTRVRAALLEVGQQGGVLDAQDDLAAGPKALIVDPTRERQPDGDEPVWDQSG